MFLIVNGVFVTGVFTSVILTSLTDSSDRGQVEKLS